MVNRSGWCFGFVWILIAGLSGHSVGAQEVYTGPEVVVRGARGAEGVAGPEASVAQEAARLPGVMLNSQGGPGGQSDLSIRGGSFSGAGFSVQGLSLGNAQTEHFNAELPLTSALFSAPKVRTGFDQALHTEGYLDGTISLSLRPIASGSKWSAGIGDYESGWAHGYVGQRLMTSASRGSLGLAAFGGVDRFQHVNYADNNNRGALGGASLQWVRDEVQLDTVAGYQEKEFGARGYYGTNPDYPAEEKTRDFLLLGSVRRGDEEHYADASAAYRDFHDDYQLDLPTVYRNEHRTRTTSAQAGGRWRASDALGAVGRISADQEELTSGSLGDHRRSHAALTLIPEGRVENWRFAAGVRQEWFERGKPATLPQAAIEWVPAEGQALELSVSRSVRQPSYTELNYESPSSLGQEGLDNQWADTLELNWKQIYDAWSLELGPFARETRDTVDWVRPTPDSTRWMAENIGTVRALGVEGSLVWMALRDVTLRADGLLLNQWDDAEAYAGRYALDYARVATRVNVAWQVTRNFHCAFDQGYRRQAENPLRNHGDEQWLAAIRFGLRLPWWLAAQLDLAAENLWDDDFEEFPGQATATGRRVYASLTVAF